jgi:TonB family protein
MKTPLLMLSAASLALAAQAAVAAPSAADGFLRQVDNLAAREIVASGAHVGSSGLKLSAFVAEGGRLTQVRVLDSSGSRAVDRKVAGAFARVRATPPVSLVGQEVSFAVRPGHIETARAD